MKRQMSRRIKIRLGAVILFSKTVATLMGATLILLWAFEYHNLFGIAIVALAFYAMWFGSVFIAAQYGLPASDGYLPRPDDSEPISDDWFRTSWPEEHREDNYAVECPIGWFEVALYGEECRDFYLSGYTWDGERLRTRGDIRQLLWYLESELIP